MKKYLMSGVAAIAFLAAFTSCSKSTDLYEEGRKEKDQQIVKEKTDAEKLTTSFETVIGGSICPTNDWGFDATVAKSSTRGHDDNNNNWATYVKVPAKLTTAQKDKVTRYFTENNKPNGISVNWSDYFFQQVSSTDWGTSHMNYLRCQTSDGTWEDLHNANAGTVSPKSPVCYDYIPIPGVDQNNWKIYDNSQDYRINFMVKSGTKSFLFHNSLDSKDYENFVIVPGDVIQNWDSSLTGTNGENADVSGLYFVGFDFEANGQSANQQVARDFFFNDWIIQICPGLYRGENTWRCFAEDLIATDLSDIDESDWDYNDAVFDAYRDYTNSQTVIILHAAGGTMQLTVGGKEVHEAFGVDVKTMVNTDNNTKNLPVAIYRIPGIYNSLNDIQVIVNGSTELKAEKGENKVPMKLAVPVGTKWLKEKVIITDGYPDFANYAHLGSPANWYETQVNNGSLVSK